MAKWDFDYYELWFLLLLKQVWIQGRPETAAEHAAHHVNLAELDDAIRRREAGELVKLGPPRPARRGEQRGAS